MFFFVFSHLLALAHELRHPNHLHLALDRAKHQTVGKIGDPDLRHQLVQHPVSADAGDKSNARGYYRTTHTTHDPEQTRPRPRLEVHVWEPLLLPPVFP